MKTTEKHLSLQYTVAELLAGSINISETIPKVLQVIAEGLNWSLGLYWMPNEAETQLELLATWSRLEKTESFVLINQKIELIPGKGSMECVWVSRVPLWITDITKESNFDGKEEAKQLGLQTVLNYPVLFKDKVQGVMGFYSNEIYPPNDEVLEMLAATGSQIGQFIERIKSETALRNSDMRKAAILNAALDCIITIDPTGIITEFNPSAERTFGYSREDAIGKPLVDLIITPAYREKHCQGFSRYLETRQGNIIGKRLEFSAMKVDGTEFPIELIITELQVDKTLFFTGFIRDISEKKRTRPLQRNMIKDKKTLLECYLTRFVAL